MDVNALKIFDCACGKVHDTNMELVEISQGAFTKVPEYLRSKGATSVYVVADQNTYKAAGAALEGILTEAGIGEDTYVIPATGDVVPDEKTIMGVILGMKKDYDLIIAVGSGTINDICKYISFRLNMDYMVCATAPSMDGFASIGSALMLNNLKTTVDCHVPKAIFADVDVLKEAPMDMITAGLGDILGKYTCLCDWKLSSIINGEYYCDAIVKMVQGYIKKVVETADQVKTRSPEAIAAITEALIGTGIAMSFVGNSRPASGSEHHISHYWEMKFLFEGRKPAFHGTKVAIGTVAIIRLYEMLMDKEIDFAKAKEVVAAYDEDQWAEKMTRLYGVSAPGVIALEKEVQKNSKEKHAERIQVIEEKWPEIKAMVQEALPDTSYIENILFKLGAPYNPEQVGVGSDMVADSIIVAKEVRNRYGLLQLLWDLGIAEEMGEKIADYFAHDQKLYKDMLQEKYQKKIDELKCFVLDMDGTIYLGQDLFPFTPAFLDKVTETGREMYFFTNNSSKSQQAYIDKLDKMGIHIEPKQMMISSHVMIKYLQENYPGKSIYVVGTPSLINEFKSFDMNLVEDDPDIVVLGFDTSLTYEKMEKACHAIRHGCVYFGINPDWNCPIEGGEFIPDCGSMAKMIEGSTGRWPDFFGKPSKHTLDYMIKESGYKPNEIAIVGDRLYTDIAVADGSEVTSIMVLTGEATLDDVAKSNIKPDMIVNSLEDITNML